MGDVVRYRLGWRQTPWPVVLVLLVMQAVQPGPDGEPWSGRVPFLVSCAVLGIAFCALARLRWSTELRPEGLVATGLRRRVVPWPDVSAVTVERVLGSELVRVLTRDRAFRLRAPQRTPFLAPDPEFDARVETIVRYRNAAT